MKLGKIVNQSFQQAFRNLAAQEMPLRAAFFVKGIEKQIKEEIEKYDASRIDCLKRLGNTKEDGKLEQDENGNVKLSEENMKKFSEELQSLVDVDVAVSSIKINDLGAKISMSPAEVSLLEDIIKE
jgi:hypothetical protein